MNMMTQDTNYLPLTDAQAGIWYAQCRDPENPIYKTGEYLLINGAIDVTKIKQAITQGINEVDSLHSRYITTVQGPRMYIHRQPWQVSEQDFSGYAQPLQSAIEWMRQALRTPVDLEEGPLFSMAIVKLDTQQHAWFLSLHHIAIDGYSMSLIISRVAYLYNQLVKSEAIEPVQFVDQQALIKEDDDYKASEKYQKDKDYYLQRYQDHSDTVNLAGKPTVTSDHFWRLKGHLSAVAFTHMAKFAKHCRTHWYSVLMAAMSAYVHKMTRSQNVVLGVPLMGRLGSVAIQTPAMRVNILPVRVDFDGDENLVSLVKKVNKEFASVRRHQGYRYEELHRDLHLVKDGRNLFGPLLNIMPFEYEHDFAGAKAQAHNLNAGPVDDMSFYCYELDGHLNIDIDANPALYSQVELEKHQTRLFQFIESFVSHGLRFAQGDEPTAHLSDVSLLMPQEREELIYANNQTQHKVPSTTLTQLLQAQRTATPEAQALVFEQQSMTYGQLSERIAQCANWMLDKDIQVGDRVAVLISRSVELIVAQQAILACGAVYVPVDPEYPEDRIEYILKSSEPKLVLTQSQYQTKLAHTALTVALDSDDVKALCSHYDKQLPKPSQLSRALLPSDAAYMIYTSGSTGNPKGVVVGHQAIVNRLLWMQHEYPLTHQDAVLQKTPAGFDVSVWEFFWPMIVGAKLILAKPEGHKDPIYLAQLIEQHKITTVHFVPSMLQVFVQQADASSCASLRQVFCSGEALPVDLVNEYYRLYQAQLHNLYGPTEAAIDVTYFACHAGQDYVSVPIGRPVWNTQIYILDAQLNPVPKGVIGDLYIGGEQLAQGYFNQPQLSAQRFIANPFIAGERIYLSGDLARWREDGAIEYAGRSDFQVKIRGFRIELEEIEHALMQQNNIPQAAVLAHEYNGSDKRLVAYVVSQDGSELDQSQMQKMLLQRLPEYMVPGYFVQLDAFPVTANGKLNRNALPKPDLSGKVGNTGPSNLVEERLCKLFCQLLELPSVGTEDNFFELGGHSLLAAKLIAYVKEIMGIELSLAAVFEAPTVKGIAAKLAGSNDDQALNILLPLRKREGQPALFCVHPAGGLSWCYAALTPVIPSHIPLYGVQSGNLSNTNAPLPTHMKDMARDYVKAIREEQPFGPYHLMGWSIGGMIAHAMAAEFQRQGEQVGLLVLLDSYPTEQWQEMNPPGEHEALGALIRMAGIEFDESAHACLTRPEVVTILQEAGSSMAHLEADTITAMIEVVVNNNSRVRDQMDYVYKGDMLFFSAIKPEEEAFLNKEGWMNYMNGNINVVDVDCIHRDMMKPDELKLIGGHIADALNAYPAS